MNVNEEQGLMNFLNLSDPMIALTSRLASPVLCKGLTSLDRFVLGLSWGSSSCQVPILKAGAK